VTNPKGYLFFTALLPQFIDATTPVLPQYLHATAGKRCAGRFGSKLIARMDRLCGGVFLALAGGLAMLRRAGA